MTKKLLISLAIIAISGCSVYMSKKLDDLYGHSMPRERLVSAESDAGVFYRHSVKPVLENRCVVCHGCYDAPCQLKLSSPAGIDRGASKDKVYVGARLRASMQTRLYEDAQTTEEWRQMSFFPVLNERNQQADINLQASLLYQMLDLKRQHPLPRQALLDESFDLSLDRKQQCSTLQDWDSFAARYPLWGMPYATPALSDEEFATLEHWLHSGAKMAGEPALDNARQKLVDRWEAFLNGDSVKQQLMARYVYEHWYLAHLYFPDFKDREFFKLVRSRTPPGQPIERISTRRPYDDPGVTRVYYRLWREQGTILAKTHMPYELGDRRMNQMQALFLDADYEVTELPGYQPEVAANPFIAYSAIPVDSRWRFILEDSRFTIMNFIKGPVCRGQVALNVINDHFWVFFVNPDYARNSQADQFFAQQQGHLRLPVESGSNALPISNWKKYSKLHGKFLEAKTSWMNQHADSYKLNLDLIWDGNKQNRNAAVTVFRHMDSASVVHGMIGNQPKTAWLIDYSLLERIHYLLVAGFDVYGNLGHQLNTRLYMDFLRMEGEFNFMALLPADSRHTLYEQWYQGAGEDSRSYIFSKQVQLQKDSDIEYMTSDPKSELLEMIRARLEPALYDGYDLDKASIPAVQWQALNRLNSYSGLAASFLPQLVFLTVTGDDGPHYYTVLHNNAHSNITSLFREDNNRLPEKDDITVVRGFIGAYPGAFWTVDETQIDDLANDVVSLHDDAGYSDLMNTYGIRRTDNRFWDTGDALTRAYKAIDPVDAGLFDYNRLENR